MRLEHKGLGASIDFVDDLLNRHVDAWMTAMREWDPKWRSLPFSDCATAYVRAGIKADMLNGLEDPDNLQASVVHWIASEIDSRIAEAITIPPE